MGMIEAIAKAKSEYMRINNRVPQVVYLGQIEILTLILAVEDGMEYGTVKEVAHERRVMDLRIIAVSETHHFAIY